MRLEYLMRRAKCPLFTKARFGFILFSLIVSGCIKERELQPNGYGKGEVILTVNVPGIVTPGARALDLQDESHLETLDVLVFRDNGAGNEETFMYRTHATDLDGTGATRKVLVRLQPSGDDLQRLVLFANLRDELDAVFSAGLINEDDEKSDGLASINFLADDKWLDGMTKRYLPMWGESPVTVKVTTTLQSHHIGEINLLRSVARIDVGLDFDSGGEPQGFGNLFKINTVKVYNAMDMGSAAPQAANYDPTRGTEGRGAVQFPSIPAAADKLISSPVTYPIATPHTGIVREIYIAEANNTDPTISHEEITCLLLGGYYDGSPVETWYRIDIFDPNASEEGVLQDFLRNHRYIVNIISVDGPGYDDEDKALKSKGINLQTKVIVWDEGELGDITFDGQYSLRVSIDSLGFYDEGRAQKMWLKTDCPDGWEIDSIPSWITVSPLQGLKDSRDTLTVTATNIGTSGLAERQDWFMIKAGKLRKKIKVFQTDEVELTIDISPTTLVFRKGAPLPKSVTVTVYPHNSIVYFVESPGVNPISWLSTGYPTSGLPNISVYEFQPDINNTGDLLSSFVTIYITDADGNTVSRTVTISQLATDILFNYSTTTYPPDGGSRASQAIYFTVEESHADWRVDGITDNPDNIINGYDAGIQPMNTVAMKFYFGLTENPDFRDRAATFKITSDDPEFADRYITITQSHASPYIDVPDQMKTLFLGDTETGTQQGVSLATNTMFTYTTSGQWDEAVASVAGMQPGDILGSSNALSEYQQSVTFHPVAYPAQVLPEPTPAAGIRYTGSATFASTNHDTNGNTVAQVTQNVSVTREVPSYFTFLSVAIVPGDVDYLPVEVTIMGMTNDAFAVRAKYSNTEYTGNSILASDYAEDKTSSLTIPENDSWSSRTLDLYYVYRGTDVAINQSVYQGPGYYITSIYRNSASISPTGGSASIIANGRFSSLSVRAHIQNAAATAYPTGTIPQQLALNGGSSVSGTMTIGPNYSGKDRTITLQFADPRNNNTWTTIGTQGGAAAFTQSRYGYAYGNIFLVAPSNKTGTLSSLPDSYCVTNYGAGWRLPTINEVSHLNHMIHNNSTYGNSFPGGYYQLAGNQYAYMQNGKNYYTGSGGHGTSCYIRCVRALSNN